MFVKDDDAALLTQGKEEDAGRRKIDRKDGLVFKLSDYITRDTELVPMIYKALPRSAQPIEKRPLSFLENGRFHFTESA